MPDVSFKRALDEIEIWLEDISEETHDKLKRAIRAGGMAIQKRARENAPWDNGDLTNSIISTDIIKPDDFAAEIGPTVKHGPYLEFGTRPHFPPVEPLERWAQKHGMAGAGFNIARKISRVGTKPKPYLIPAYNVVAPKVLKAIDSIVKGIK